MELLDLENTTPTDSDPATGCVACSTLAAPEHLYTVGGFRIQRCPSCGLGRTVISGSFDPKAIYTEAYFQGGHSDGYADYKGSQEYLAAEFRHILRDMAIAGATQGKLLEIGCAYGFFLDEARASFEVCGVELAPEAVSSCRNRGLDVVRQTDPSFLAERGPFDVAVMLDVIEHLEDPEDILRDLHKHMRPGGILVITTGDFGSIAARAMARRWRLMTPPQHLWYFTTDAMAKVLERTGFRVTGITHPSKRVPLSLIAFQLARYFGVQHWVRGRKIEGSISINLHDAMRVFAERV